LNNPVSVEGWCTAAGTVESDNNSNADRLRGDALRERRGGVIAAASSNTDADGEEGVFDVTSTGPPLRKKGGGMGLQGNGRRDFNERRHVPGRLRPLKLISQTDNFREDKYWGLSCSLSVICKPWEFPQEYRKAAKLRGGYPLSYRRVRGQIGLQGDWSS